MKTIVIALALIGCSQSTEDQSIDPQDTPNTDVSATVDAPSIHSTHSSLSAPEHTNDTPPSEPEPPQTDGEGAVVLQCTSSAWDYFSTWGAPEGTDLEEMFDVHRITITDQGDHHMALVQTGHPHNPSDVIHTVEHRLTYFEQDDSSIRLDWHGVGLSGWKNEEQTVFTGGAWGDLERPTIISEDPLAPPCGYEVILSCWDPNDVEPQFQYDADTGLCLDADGVEGLNHSSVEYIRDTKDGECAYLDWAVLNELVPFNTKLDSWNLRGASLNAGALSESPDDQLQPAFVVLSNAQLQGADLSNFSVPNGVIEGSIDGYSKLPNIDCNINGSRAECMN